MRYLIILAVAYMSFATAFIIYEVTKDCNCPPPVNYEGMALCLLERVDITRPLEEQAEVVKFCNVVYPHIPE